MNKVMRSMLGACIATKITARTALVVLLFACNQQPGKNSPYNASGFDMAKDEAAAQDTLKPVKTHDPCDPTGMAGYEMASPFAQSIANDSAWYLNDGSDGLALLDSFRFSSNADFYRALVLRTVPKADGAYSEALGSILHDRLLSDPCTFLRCCWENGCDGDMGLRSWTNVIAREILIQHEKDPWAAFLEYGRQVEVRAKAECDLQTASRTNEFLHRIGAHLRLVLHEDANHASR